jgi:hypothetical protein
MPNVEASMTYDLRRLRLKGINSRVPNPTDTSSPHSAVASPAS